MLNWLFTNWMNLTITAVSILIGIFVSWWFYRKSIRNAAVSYLVEDVLLIEHKADDKYAIEELAVTWQGQPIPRVTKSTVAIWNSGTEVIDSQGIVEHDRPRIVATGGAKLLRCQISTSTRDVTKCIVETIDPHEAALAWHHLNAGDGMVFEVIHTGGFGALAVQGSIKGVVRGLQPVDRFRSMAWLYKAIVIMVGITCIVMTGMFGFMLYEIAHQPWPKNLRGTMYLLSLPALAIFIFVMDKRKRDPQPTKISGVPDPLAARFSRFGMTFDGRDSRDVGV